jgi:hypothetical protein
MAFLRLPGDRPPAMHRAEGASETGQRQHRQAATLAKGRAAEPNAAAELERNAKEVLETRP